MKCVSNSLFADELTLTRNMDDLRRSDDGRDEIQRNL